MSNDSKENNGNSSISIVAIVLLLLSVTGTLIEPLTSARPDDPGLNSPKQAKNVELNETRLWQDPIDLMNNQFAQESWDPCAYTNVLQQELKNFHRYRDFSVVAISVSGSSYYEIVETRRRNRFAVVSALNAKKYYPGNEEQLGYYRLKSETERCDKKDSMDFVPYEWFDREETKSSSVLVIWLDESRIKKTTDSYRNFIDRLIKEIKNEQQDVLKENGQIGSDFDFKLIGPSGTSLLVDLVRSDPVSYPNFRVFVHSATTPDQKIIRSLQASCSRIMKEGRPWYCPSSDEALKQESEKPESERLEKGLKTALKDRKIIRSIGTDDQLANALLWELWHRGINNSHEIYDFSRKQKCEDGLVLVTELDTLYARSLTHYLSRNRFWDHCTKTGDDPPVRSFAYLRGVDGKMPNISSKNAEDKSAKDNNKNTPMHWDDSPPEHAEGRNQFDYLRRLSNTIAELDDDKNFAKNGVKAIGILGSDIYDKLIILQALRTRFKDKLFFTTDLDARYLHVDQLKWTQNLIVASNFDFTLHSDWQGKSMPFRDSYQTSIYHSVLLALNEIHPEPKEWDGILSGRLQSQDPQLFEIGRTRAIHLDSPNVDGLGKWPGCLNSLDSESASATECNSIDTPYQTSEIASIDRGIKTQPDYSLQQTSRIEIIQRTIYILVACALIFLGHTVLTQRLDLSDRQALVTHSFLKPRSWIAILACTLITLVCIRAFIHEDVFEPFIWSEGISVWPNLTIRLMGIFLILLLAWQFYNKLRNCRKEVTTSFFPTPHYVTESSEKRCDIPIKNEVSTPWKKYLCIIHNPKMCWGIQTATAIAVALTLSFLTMNDFKAFGSLNFPYRGELAYILHMILLLTQFWILWNLIFWIAFEAKACGRFIEKINGIQSNNTESIRELWPSDILDKFQRKTGVSCAHLNRYVQFQIVVRITDCISRLVYLPLGMILTILIGRSRIFDQFGIPLSLIIVFSVAIIYLFAILYQLCQSAESLRGTLKEDYQSRQVVIRAKQEKEEEAQIDRLIGLIRNERRGIYANFGHQPAFAALLLPFGGMSGVQILEYLFNI